MADPKRRLAGNVPGEFFVDARCIDCDACRQLAPEVFSAVGGYSVVSQQPATPELQRRASQAVFACPTGSIGVTDGSTAYRKAIEDFPLHLESNVYYCGFNSEKSYGGNSYLVRHPDGNWLIDSPRFTRHLVDKFKAAGGLKYIFLTHRDDVADAAKYAREFGAKRIIHRLELHAQPDAEIVIEGTDPVRILPDLVVIPTPGHTRGHCCLLYGDRFLFTGDHLDWDRDGRCLDASESYC
jgi:ferredoxin